MDGSSQLPGLQFYPQLRLLWNFHVCPSLVRVGFLLLLRNMAVGGMTKVNHRCE